MIGFGVLSHFERNDLPKTFLILFVPLKREIK